MDNTLVEGDKTIHFKLSDPTGGAQLAESEAVLIIVDNETPESLTPASEDDPGMIGFYQKDYQIDEAGSGGALIWVERFGCGAKTPPVSISYATEQGGTATIGEDYERVTGSFSWEANDCGSKSFEVAIIDDTSAENQETVFLTLSEPTGGAKGIQTRAQLTIIDNDSSTIGFSHDNYLVNEGEQSVSITVERTGCDNYHTKHYTKPAASVWYLVYEGDHLAASKQDYQTLRGELSWETDQCLPLTFEVPIVDDSEVEGDETISLELVSLSGAQWGKNHAVLTIIDNEPLENQVGTPGSRPMTVKMALNQNLYLKDDPLRLEMIVDGMGEADLYIAISSPNGEIVTLSYPDKWSSQLKTHQAYLSDIKIAGKQVYPILNMPIPAGLALGTYTLCGLLVDPNAVEILNQANWIYWDCPTLRIHDFSPFRDTLQDGSLGPEMIVMPAGTFLMGDIQGGGYSYEKPVHEVSVARFAIGRYEVTNAEFVHFLNTSKRRGPEGEPWFTTKAESYKYRHITGSTGNFIVEAGYENHPVIGVSWYAATAYLNWLAEQTGKPYRLPTESEWEYAARAGTETKYWWGNDFGKNRANCGSGWSGETAPVGSFEA
ncbi:MAG: SUMF1/EgtB/PvdO family nonheme iron enzyme, partial [Candidatus Parabeggiatoa sp.]